MTMANCLRRSSRHASASTISTRRCTDSGSCANRDLKIASIAGEMSTATTDTSSRASGTVRRPDPAPISDRKSTRLNSSHGYISYAVFCLKKKKKKKYTINEELKHRQLRERAEHESR